MTTPLDKTLKRALKINGRDYVVALSPESIKITLKAHRHGVELKWVDLVSGEAALATALQASIGKLIDDKKPTTAVASRERGAVEPAKPRKGAKRVKPRALDH
jgi:hypothetical protein